MNTDSFYDSLKVGVIMHFSAASGIIFQYLLFILFAVNVTKAKSFYFQEKMICKYSKSFLGGC